MQQQYNSLTQQQLKSLYNTTGSILLIDIPQGLQFGIDNILWKIGHKFKGIKFIPYGTHIISYTQKDQNNQFKINKFLYFDQSKSIDTQIIILKWSFKYSMFLQLRGAQASGYRQGVKNYHFDSYLGPYPQSNLQFWRQNTSYITRQVLQKLDPIQKIYKFEQQYEKIREEKGQQMRIDIDQDQQVEQIAQQQNEQLDEQQQKQIGQKQKINEQVLVNNKKSKKQVNMSRRFESLSDTIYYSQIPRMLCNDPVHINKVNINKTQLFIQVVFKQWISLSKTHGINSNNNTSVNNNNKITNNNISTNNNKSISSLSKQSFSHIYGILGQIQYSFIYFLIGQDQDSLQQWKKLINLFVFSQDLFQQKQLLQLKKYQLSKGNIKINQLIDHFQLLSSQFIIVLYNQLKQFPIDFFIDQLSKNSFMETCIKRLQQYKNQQQGIISKKIKKRLSKLFTLLTNKFNYDPNTNDQQDIYNQDAPIIVENQQSYF